MNKYGFSLSDVSSLLEAVEQMQNKIADSGSDAIESNEGMPSAKEDLENVNSAEEAPAEEQPEDLNGLDDANYLQNNAQPMTQADTINKQKSIKLFGLFKDLLTYSKTFYECLDTIDDGLLEDEDIEQIDTFLKRINEIGEKINHYLLNTFNEDKYEKQLYVYILLRTELLTAIKNFRKILKLNEPKENK